MNGLDRLLAETTLTCARRDLAAIEARQPLHGFDAGSPGYYAAMAGTLQSHARNLADALEKALGASR
jgi:hypothetical protein